MGRTSSRPDSATGERIAASQTTPEADERSSLQEVRGRPVGGTGPALVGMIAMARDPLGFLVRSFVDGGDFVQTRIGPTRRYRYAYLAARPEYAEHVLKTNQNNYIKPPTYLPIKRFLGEGLLTSEGDTWLRHRRLAQPSFYKDKLRGWTETMGTTCAAMLDGFRDSASRGPVDISLEFSRITLAVVGRTLFHSDLTRDGSVVAPALATIQRHIERRVPFVFTPRLFELIERAPTPENRRNRAATERLDALIMEIIAGHRSAGDGENDLLTSLMAARDEGRGLTDSELRDEAMTFLLAGHETTANALTWAWYLLSKNPAVLEELEREVESVVSGDVPTSDEVERLEFTRAAIEEAMRLYPPAWLIERESVVDDDIGGHRVPSGSVVMVSPYVTHRHPDVWSNPEAFDPRRFVGAARDERPPFAYFPFGGGRRQCIGAGFAMIEAVVIAAIIAARFRFELVPGQKIEPDPRVTLGAKNGILMNVKPRR